MKVGEPEAGVCAAAHGAKGSSQVISGEWGREQSGVIRIDFLFGEKPGSASKRLVPSTGSEGAEKQPRQPQMKKDPGLKPLVADAFFAGLKPCAPSEKAQRRVFPQAVKPAFTSSPVKPLLRAACKAAFTDSPVKPPLRAAL